MQNHLRARLAFTGIIGLISVILGLILLAFLNHQLLLDIMNREFTFTISPIRIAVFSTATQLLLIESGITLIFSIVAFVLWLGEISQSFSSTLYVGLGLLRLLISGGLIFANWKPGWYYLLDPIRPEFFALVCILGLGALQALGFLISTKNLFQTHPQT